VSKMFLRVSTNTYLVATAALASPMSCISVPALSLRNAQDFLTDSNHTSILHRRTAMTGITSLLGPDYVLDQERDHRA
jgi:hypothetical protein